MTPMPSDVAATYAKEWVAMEPHPTALQESLGMMQEFMETARENFNNSCSERNLHELPLESEQALKEHCSRCEECKGCMENLWDTYKARQKFKYDQRSERGVLVAENDLDGMYYYSYAAASYACRLSPDRKGN